MGGNVICIKIVGQTVIGSQMESCHNLIRRPVNTHLRDGSATLAPEVSSWMPGFCQIFRFYTFLNFYKAQANTIYGYQLSLFIERQ